MDTGSPLRGNDKEAHCSEEKGVIQYPIIQRSLCKRINP